MFRLLKLLCSPVILMALLCSVSSVASSKAASGEASGIARQLVEYLNIDLAKFIIAKSVIPQPFLLKLATTERQYVEAELVKQQDIYHQRLIDKLTILTNGHLGLSMSAVPELITAELDKQLQEFISLFTADTHDMMHVSRLNFAIRNTPEFLLDRAYGIDVFVSDAKDNAIDAITMFTPQEELRSYFENRDALLSELSADLIFAPYHYVLNGRSGVHLFERKLRKRKFLHLDTTPRKILLLADNVIAVVSGDSGSAQTVHKFSLFPFARLETLQYAGELLQLSSSGRLAAVRDGSRLVIYRGNTQEFVFDQAELGGAESVAGLMMVQFIEAEQLLAVVVGDEVHGYKLTHIDLQQGLITAMAVLPARPLQLLGVGSSTYVLTAQSLLRFDADGNLAYSQNLQYSQPKHLYAYEDKRLILISDKHLQIIRTEDGGEDFTVYVGDKFRIVDHTISERYATLLIEKIVHDASFTLSLVQLPVARIIAMFSEDNLLKLAPYAMLDLAHNRTLPLIWNGRAFTLQ